MENQTNKSTESFIIEINSDHFDSKPFKQSKGGRLHNVLMRNESPIISKELLEEIESFKKEDMTRNYTTRSIYDGMILGGTINKQSK